MMKSCPCSTTEISPLTLHLSDTADIPRPWGELGVDVSSPLTLHLSDTADIPRPWGELGVDVSSKPDRYILIAKTKQKLDKLHRRAVESLKPV
ncbi:hypothetical protein QE152_g32479 [Popillia japonica]|uniref:Uncharacterized protein n=1 Tax=Popillia japonica TaxID=7064 RepID=A0AAW1IZG6_POPJA